MANFLHEVLDPEDGVTVIATYNLEITAGVGYIHLGFNTEYQLDERYKSSTLLVNFNDKTITINFERELVTASGYAVPAEVYDKNPSPSRPNKFQRTVSDTVALPEYTFWSMTFPGISKAIVNTGLQVLELGSHFSPEEISANEPIEE